MKPITITILLILASLCQISCRESEEHFSVKSFENKQGKSSKFKKDTNSIEQNPPKDPPIRGHGWRKRN